MNGEAGGIGKYIIQKIFSDHFPAYREAHSLSPEQVSAANCIMQCKTGDLGYNYYECSECGHVVKVPRSCGNRNCPSCQAVSKAAWLEERKGELIDAPYFHVVGTLPHELNPVIAANRKPLYELLQKSMGKTLVELTNDPDYLGASPGIIQILHTWDQKLNYHVHIHCVVSGGGLTKDKQLITLPKDASFFIPIKVVSTLYRGKFLDGLKKLYGTGKLVIPESEKDLASANSWNCFISQLYKTEWNVHIKQTFNGNGNAIEYLSRYTNRIAISNSRILSYSDGNVTFSYTDRKDGGKKKELTLTAHEFIRRYLQHVIPKKFQKIRYYGFLNNSTRKKNLKIIFSQQGGRKYTPKFDRSSSIDEIVSAAWGMEGRKCPCCGNNTLTFIIPDIEIQEIEASTGKRPKVSFSQRQRARPA